MGADTQRDGHWGPCPDRGERADQSVPADIALEDSRLTNHPGEAQPMATSKER